MQSGLYAAVLSGGVGVKEQFLVQNKPLRRKQIIDIPSNGKLFQQGKKFRQTFVLDSPFFASFKQAVCFPNIEADLG